MKLGTAIKLIRTSSGLKQKEIATRLGVTSNYISLVESGNREPSVSLLKKMASVFGVPVGLFFLWEDGEDASSKENINQLRRLLAQLEAMYVLANRSRRVKRNLA
ncbi:MAG: helix-turn-helix domain-containing protein [Acidobacteriia bacterium]|nr:helix-turn-helix domain-containing protein [Terriglobia bacterium]